MSAPLPKFDKTFLLANNFGTGNHMKFGCWNYPPFSGNKSIIKQYHILQPRVFLKKKTEANSLGLSKPRANMLRLDRC